MFDNRSTSEGRVHRFLREMLPARRILDTAPLTISAWEVPDEPVPFAEAVGQEYTPISVGDRWGRPWSTLWLHVTGTVPEAWSTGDDRDVELQLDLSFTNSPGFQAEALIWTPEGETIKAINPLNQYLTLEPGQDVDLYLELAANPSVSGNWVFAPTHLGDKATAGEDPIYDLTQLRLVWRSKDIWELEQDVRALFELMAALPEETTRRQDILRTLEDALDVADPDDLHATAPAAREVLRRELDKPANASAMTVVATGHAHIDSAWLWPVRETIRKCARTFSNVCWLLERYDDLNFSCSSAQQYEWIRDFYPGLFERIKGHVKSGRFIPVGGMWVESDTNMPGSEAMARQFIHGKSFFMNELGVETRETWLPDSFGYSAALPQICAAANNTHFLTQKVSWNQYSTFPHHTFSWEGLDGTTQFTHFPPADTYNGMLSAAELLRVEQNFKDKGRSHYGLTPTGWGDGGGGPTREHIASAKRFKNLEGTPKVEWASPTEFFEKAEAEYGEHLPRWNGELYLELHRGTYSSQIPGKQGNRRSEALMHDVELWCATAARLDPSFTYPAEEIHSLWSRVLLLQFHDILPGSSIAWVHREAEQNYEGIAADGEKLVEAALAAIARTQGVEAEPAAEITGIGADRPRVFDQRATAAGDGSAQAVSVDRNGDTITLDTPALHVEIDEGGRLTSLREGADGREMIAPGAGGAVLQLHRDTPNAWDSWDIDEFYHRIRRDLPIVGAPELETDEDGTVRVRATYRTRGEDVLTQEQPHPEHPANGAGSEITLTYSVAPGAEALGVDLDIDWHERKKVLKLAFPLDLRAPRMSSEIQFGHIDRPIPVNTLEDFGRFETCAHRWVRVQEGRGTEAAFALANDSSYGHDARRLLREDGGTTTVVRATVIRAAMFPDPTAEEGRHRLRYAVKPSATIAQAIQLGEDLNQTARTVPGGTELQPLAVVSGGEGETTARVQTVKLAEDGSGDVIVRLYEAEGERTTATVQVPGATRLVATDLLERPLGPDSVLAHRAQEAQGEEITRTLSPFEIMTVRASF